MNFGNLELASNRAMAVFKFLQWGLQIDPAMHMMSATSFGEYKPVTRNENKKFTPEELATANQTEELRAKNRRIELLIIYNQ